MQNTSKVLTVFPSCSFSAASVFITSAINSYRVRIGAGIDASIYSIKLQLLDTEVCTFCFEKKKKKPLNWTYTFSLRRAGFKKSRKGKEDNHCVLAGISSLMPHVQWERRWQWWEEHREWAGEGGFFLWCGFMPGKTVTELWLSSFCNSRWKLCVQNAPSTPPQGRVML